MLQFHSADNRLPLSCSVALLCTQYLEYYQFTGNEEGTDEDIRADMARKMMKGFTEEHGILPVSEKLSEAHKKGYFTYSGILHGVPERGYGYLP